MSYVYEYTISKAIDDDTIDSDMRLKIIDGCIELCPSFDINYKESQALFTAISNGDYPLIKLLIEHGINITARDNQAIIDTCDYGMNYNIIKILLEYGADPIAQDNQPIINICGNDDPDIINIIKLLIEYGADPLARNNEAITRAGNITIVKFLINLGADPFAQNNKLLCNSCTYNNASMVEFLISIGANCIELNNEPICKIFNSNRSIELKKLLLDNGADPNATDIIGNLLEKSIYNLDLAGCELLLEYNVNINLSNLESRFKNGRYYRVSDMYTMEKIINLFKENNIDISYILNWIKN